MARRSSATPRRAWLDSDEKFAFVAINVSAEDDLSASLPDWPVEFASFLDFEMPSHWAEWLGSMRTDEINASNLFILARSNHSPAGIVDAESMELSRKVWNAYIGLLVACPFVPSDDPVQIGGGFNASGPDVREQRNLDATRWSHVTGYQMITSEDAIKALRIGQVLDGIRDPEKTGGYWRLIRTIAIFVEACSTLNILDRIHQYCRCLEGLIASEPGKGKAEFKSRTELFIGPSHHPLMASIYDVRGAVEHVREEDYLHPFDRERMLSIIRWEAVMAALTRSCLSRIMLSADLRSHFFTQSSVKRFWSLTADDRQALWGPHVDPLDVLKSFNEKYVTDEALGA